MASPGKFVQEVARALGLPEATVRDHDRNLRAAGLRSKSGRGRGAAAVTARDAASLLTAILGSAQVKQSVETLRRYAESRPHRDTSSDRLFASLAIGELNALPSDHSFVDGLEALIASAAAGSLGKRLARAAAAAGATLVAVAPLIEVMAFTPGTLGEIRIAGLNRRSACVRYAPPNPWDGYRTMTPPEDAVQAWEAKIRTERGDGDLEQSRRVSARTLVRIADLLTQKKGQGT